MHTGFCLAPTSLRWGAPGSNSLRAEHGELLCLVLSQQEGPEVVRGTRSCVPATFLCRSEPALACGPLQVSSQKLSACPEPSPSLTEPGKNGTRQSTVSVLCLFPGHSLTLGTQGSPFQLTGAWQGRGTHGRAGHVPCPSSRLSALIMVLLEQEGHDVTQ